MGERSEATTRLIHSFRGNFRGVEEVATETSLTPSLRKGGELQFLRRRAEP
jgi:hypothetical protein